MHPESKIYEAPGGKISALDTNKADVRFGISSKSN